MPVFRRRLHTDDGAVADGTAVATSRNDYYVGDAVARGVGGGLDHERGGRLCPERAFVDDEGRGARARRRRERGGGEGQESQEEEWGGAASHRDWSG